MTLQQDRILLFDGMAFWREILTGRKSFEYVAQVQGSLERERIRFFANKKKLFERFGAAGDEESQKKSKQHFTKYSFSSSNFLNYWKDGRRGAGPTHPYDKKSGFFKAVKQKFYESNEEKI